MVERDRKAQINQSQRDPIIGRPVPSVMPSQVGQGHPLAPLHPHPLAPSPALTLTIDHLVLHGFPRHQALHLSDGIQRELTRLFAEQGTPPGLKQESAIEQLHLRDVQVRPGARPAEIATQIAQAIYTNLNATQPLPPQRSRQSP